MIAYLKGEVIKTLPPDQIIVRVHGLGYKVGVGAQQLTRLKLADEIELYTHLVVRETGQELYGFAEFDKLQMFEMLIEISGVGPKMAMGILDLATPDEIKSAVAAGNGELFRAVSGIGKKNAGRIILEMRSKLEGPNATGFIPAQNDDVAEALKGLGYRYSEINNVLRVIDRNQPTEKQLTEALKQLSR